MPKFYKLLLIVFTITLSSCDDGDCKKMYTLSGTIVDGSMNPIQTVEVFEVSHFGTQMKIAETDINGEFSHTIGEYSSLGKGYLIFRKTGYQDYSTQSQPIRDGDGTCAPQTIVRDAVMTP